MPALKAMRGNAQIQAVLATVCRAYGCERSTLLRAGGKGNEARAVAMLLSWDCGGMSLKELAEVFNAPGYTAAAQMIRRTRLRGTEGELRFPLSTLMSKCLK